MPAGPGPGAGECRGEPAAGRSLLNPSISSKPPEQPADRIERDAGRAESLDVAEDRALGDLKLGGQLPGAHPPAGLEQAQQPDQTAGSQSRG